MAVPCFPARPVRPDRDVSGHADDDRRIQIHTNTVDVGFDSVRHLIVNDQTDVLDINTTTGKVRGDEEI